MRAGPLSAEYDGGSLRYIRFGDREILRRVLVAVRDADWNTLQAQLSNETLTAREDSFRLEFDARNGDFGWRGVITGDSDGTIRWAMDGQPLLPFWRNRIGFCVLHPATECAGRECEVEHVDGSSEHSRFPGLVAPHQPFLRVRSLSHEVAEGVRAKVRMDGDIFETEDQRNWSDASYKTYSTPLSLPYPVLVKPGDRVRQSVELRVSGNRSPHASDPGFPRLVVDRTQRYAMPSITGPRTFGFVDLNRGRDVVRWEIDPQIHADDELTMIENLAGQAPMIRTAREFCGDRPIHISVKVPPIRSAPGWVAVSIGELAQAGANVIGYNAQSPVLEEIGESRPAYVLGCRSSAPLKCGALVLPQAMWVANFLDIPLTVMVEGAETELKPFELRRIAMENPA